MGIKGLTRLLNDEAPGCSKEQKFEAYFGRKVAVDASMHIYQFMVAVGRTGDQLLTNDAGEITSHILGMFYRTVRMLEAGIKPVYVFDGKPPELKTALLASRSDRRGDAEDALKAAIESGNQEDIEKFSKRTIRVTKQHNEECKKLLRLMGVPVVEAPSEAEAQCSTMAASGVVYGIATEDMDALTFGAPRVFRHLMASSSAALPVVEFDRAKAIEQLGLTSDQFIDLCILMGCDYSQNIRGVGPVTALKLIQKHGSIEGVLEHLDLTKFPLPDQFPFKEAREFFKNPEVLSTEQLPPLKWTDPDTEGLVTWLVGEKGFQEERVRNGIKKILAAKGKATQGRMESYFQVIAKPASEKSAAKGKDAKGKDAGKGKRAAGAGSKEPAAKKGKSGVGGGKKK